MPAELTALHAGMADTLAGLGQQIDALAARGAIPGPSQLTARLFGLAVRLPLSVDPALPGVIRDAEGDEIAIVDPQCSRQDANAGAIAALIVMAVNATAGVRRAIPPDDDPE